MSNGIIFGVRTTKTFRAVCFLWYKRYIFLSIFSIVFPCITINPQGFLKKQTNANVKTEQAQTLTNAYRLLAENGTKVRRSRMDAGSYAKEIIEVVAEHSVCSTFAPLLGYSVDI